IAFLGDVADYIVEHELWFDEYVKHYTDAPVSVDDGFRDTEDADGLFSGWDPEKGQYDVKTWRYQGMEVHGSGGDPEQGFSPKGEQAGHGGHGGGLKHGEPPVEDRTLKHPRCIFQIL